MVGIAVGVDIGMDVSVDVGVGVARRGGVCPQAVTKIKLVMLKLRIFLFMGYRPV